LCRYGIEYHSDVYQYHSSRNHGTPQRGPVQATLAVERGRGHRMVGHRSEENGSGGYAGGTPGELTEYTQVENCAVFHEHPQML